MFKPQLEELGARIVLSTYNWVGAAGGNWSTNTNWEPAGIPGSGDTIVFSNADKNDSTMDLGGTAYYHVGKLWVQPGYTGTITLKNPL